MRFYKAAANTGTHVGSLWTRGRHARSRTVDVHRRDRVAAGSTATFASPVALTAGTTYVASYHAPNGHYSVTGGGFASAVDNAPLHALANSTSANGVLRLRQRRARSPTSSSTPRNYWVDVLFDAAPVPGAPTGVTATAGQASATVSWTAPTSGGPARRPTR